ncbi:ABC transporter ATP-binding protein [Roseburia sp. NSJ-9]|uniref:ABC transporter ATP-binding protein n=1 Tax=Roseburia lenta TaxID=2763061 RepID=A0ABR7GGR9_9FIRM|nr:ABC transporter ATP-binding protein [Roseburia lenta]MBC5686657.1 ABC transporter ATP-binding protein [Roseburia lenta]
MSEYAIQVKNVSKMYKLYDRNRDRIMDAFGLSKAPRYHEHYALHDLNFSVKKGETVGIIGTNGAGKSTILKIITGVLNPTDGEVDINGRISALLELGAGFNMEYTGIENIYLNGTMIGFSREEIDKKLDDILKFADIGDFVYQPVKTYSSGMFVRLAFAVAINIDPEILIVDEALSVGDVFFQAKCYKKFEDFKKLGKTILFVSHDLGSVAKYCDRVVLLNKGAKIAEGNPKQMIGMYKKLLVNQLELDERTQEMVMEDEQEHNRINSPVFDNTSDKVELWKNQYKINPALDEYGNGKAHIIDFAVRDEEGTITSSIEKGTRFSILSEVKFEDTVQNPIFTYTFKNIQGTAITGTNTMYEKQEIDVANAGDVYLCEFNQEMNLQGGEYLLSISCTGYRDGDFTVYHRLYDVINISVVSDKNTVGFYDMNSKVKITKVEKGKQER